MNKLYRKLLEKAKRRLSENEKSMAEQNRLFYKVGLNVTIIKKYREKDDGFEVVSELSKHAPFSYFLEAVHKSRLFVYDHDGLLTRKQTSHYDINDRLLESNSIKYGPPGRLIGKKA